MNIDDLSRYRRAIRWGLYLRKKLRHFALNRCNNQHGFWLEPLATFVLVLFDFQHQETFKHTYHNKYVQIDIDTYKLTEFRIPKNNET